MTNKKTRNKEKSITRKRISKFVKQIRSFEELKQEDLADEIFVSRKAISKWETNISSPSVDSINELTKAYNVTFEEVVNGKLLPEESLGKVIRTIFKHPLSIFLLIIFVYFSVLILATYYTNNRIYYFNYTSNNYNINKGLIYIINDHIVIDIPSIDSDNNNDLKLIFKMNIYNKRKTIYKCKYNNYNCKSYYVKENITKRMIRKNNIYLYIINSDGEYVFNKIKVYHLNKQKKSKIDNNYCPFKTCKYHYGLLES